MKECCGTCKYHTQDICAEDFVCVNDRSEEFANWTDCDYVCDEYEEVD